MGFSAPKEPAQLTQDQEVEAQQSQQDRISLLQNQLGMEDEARSQVYGMRSTGSTNANGGGTQTGGGGNGGGGLLV